MFSGVENFALSDEFHFYLSDHPFGEKKTLISENRNIRRKPVRQS